MLDSTASANRRFLLVDGDAALASALAEQLRRLPDVDVTLAASGAEAMGLSKEKPFDLLIVASPLDDMTVESLVGCLRPSGQQTPLLLLGNDSGAEKVADAIVTRPFRLATLLAEIDALVGAGRSCAIGPYRFRPAEKLLVDPAAAREIRLTEKEAAILDYLAQAGDRTTTRELLLNEVWGYNRDVTTHTLETHVYRLRRKIEADPANAEILVSEPGGYRLARVSARGGVAMDNGKS